MVTEKEFQEIVASGYCAEEIKRRIKISEVKVHRIVKDTEKELRRILL